MKCSGDEEAAAGTRGTARLLVKSLSILDRFLPLLVLLAMILGVIIGIYAPNVHSILYGAELADTSIPLVVGMIVMMWPALTKVRYEELPRIMLSRRLWEQLGISLVLNWVVGPFVMLACAWAALPDLPTYRAGVIMVGVARCIAMVMIWNRLAGGDDNLCAIIVIVNSILQIALYSPYALLFVGAISRSGGWDVNVEYGRTAIAVLVFLGIPLALGVVTRFTLLFLLGHERFATRFLPYFSPLALIGLLYTIIIIFAQQARHILDNLGPVFRVFVPMILYFAIMFSLTFGGMWWWSRRKSMGREGYEETVVQSFTAASNNFELSIAVCVAVFGANSDEALAATIGPLVEVPVLLSLTWVSLYLARRLSWGTPLRSPGEAFQEPVEPDSEFGKSSQEGIDRSGTVDLV